MQADPEVTVVIPAYNAADHVGRALHSIRSQTFQNWRAIVVNDGSSDATAAIVNEFSDPRIRLITQGNQGVSAARNRGVREATSQWIAFLDADDEWFPEFLDRTLAAAERVPAVVAVFTDYVDSPNGLVGLANINEAALLLDNYFQFWSTRGKGISSSSVLVRRQVLMTIGGFPEGVNSGEDTDTWVRLAWTGNVAFVPAPLALIHRETPGSLMKVPKKERLYVPQVWISYLDWSTKGLIADHLQTATSKFIINRMFWYASDLLQCGKVELARAALQQVQAHFGYQACNSPRFRALKILLALPWRFGVLLWLVALSANQQWRSLKTWSTRRKWLMHARRVETSTLD